tara:strand:+ start:1310 stop:1450 length:141 start_codon:yes stop_codon:yes gene_type:complete
MLRPIFYKLYSESPFSRAKAMASGTKAKATIKPLKISFFVFAARLK